MKSLAEVAPEMESAEFVGWCDIQERHRTYKVRTTYRYHIGCYIFDIERRTESYSHAEITYSNLSGVKTKSQKGINISYKPLSKYMHYSQSSSSLSSFLLMGDFFSSFGLPGARLVAPLTRS